MTPKQLARKLAFKRAHYPISDAFEERYFSGDAWWNSQKQHVRRWLKDMDTPGPFGRKRTDYDAKHFWNHFQCAPGMLWVAEAVGIDSETVAQAAEAAGPLKLGAAQCAAVRRVIPWEFVEKRLTRE